MVQNCEKSRMEKYIAGYKSKADKDRERLFTLLKESFLQFVLSMKKLQPSSRWCVSLSDVKPYFGFLSADFWQELRVNTNCHEKFLKKKSVIRSRR